FRGPDPGPVLLRSRWSDAAGRNPSGGAGPREGRRNLMSKKRNRGLTRREFAKLTGSSALAAGVGANFLFPERAAAQQKTLKILQWSHFVPAYDTWFDGTFAKQWGEKHNTNVVVDHINLVDINTRAASEAQAKKGHDLFMFLSPPAA